MADGYGRLLNGCGLNRGPEGPAAHARIYLALLPSGPDAVRRLRLHRFRTAVQPARGNYEFIVERGGVRAVARRYPLTLRIFLTSSNSVCSCAMRLN